MLQGLDPTSRYKVDKTESQEVTKWQGVPAPRSTDQEARVSVSLGHVFSLIKAGVGFTELQIGMNQKEIQLLPN